MSKLERGLWKYNTWFHQILDFANSFDWSISWSPLANQIADLLAECGAERMVSFIGDFLLPWIVRSCMFCICSCLILVQCSYFASVVRFSFDHSLYFGRISHPSLVFNIDINDELISHKKKGCKDHWYHLLLIIIIFLIGNDKGIYWLKKEVQEKDEESSHQRKTKLQGNKYKKIQSKNKQTL